MGTILVIPNADFSGDAIDFGADFQFGVKAPKGSTYRIREYTTMSSYTDADYTSDSDVLFNWGNRTPTSTGISSQNFFNGGVTTNPITEIKINDSFWVSPTTITGFAAMFKNLKQLVRLDIGALDISNIPAAYQTGAKGSLFENTLVLETIDASKCTTQTKNYLIAAKASAAGAARLFWDDNGILRIDTAWEPRGVGSGTIPSSATIYDHSISYSTGDYVYVADSNQLFYFRRK